MMSLRIMMKTLGWSREGVLKEQSTGSPLKCYFQIFCVFKFFSLSNHKSSMCQFQVLLFLM